MARDKRIETFEELKSAHDIGSLILKAVVDSVIDAGGTLQDLRRLETDKELRKKHGALFVTDNALTIMVTDASPLPKTADGLDLVEDNAASPTGTITIGPREFLNSGEKYVNGEEMVRRERDRGEFVLGERHARALLAVQDRIPTSWRSSYLVFPGTVRQNPVHGDRCVACLHWSGELWCLYWHWLGRDWRVGGRVVCLSK